MVRPLLSLERLSLDEKEGTVCYRYGKGAAEKGLLIPNSNFAFRCQSAAISATSLKTQDAGGFSATNFSFSFEIPSDFL
jgi:hypothetical protein